jgi:hypothetical protein
VLAPKLLLVIRVVGCVGLVVRIVGELLHLCEVNHAQ